MFSLCYSRVPFKKIRLFCPAVWPAVWPAVYPAVCPAVWAAVWAAIANI